MGIPDFHEHPSKYIGIDGPRHRSKNPISSGRRLLIMIIIKVILTGLFPRAMAYINQNNESSNSFGFFGTPGIRRGHHRSTMKVRLAGEVSPSDPLIN